eukprot:14898624-Alexandrium_andersonii.AAC.1
MVKSARRRRSDAKGRGTEGGQSVRSRPEISATRPQERFRQATGASRENDLRTPKQEPTCVC